MLGAGVQSSGARLRSQGGDGDLSHTGASGRPGLTSIGAAVDSVGGPGIENRGVGGIGEEREGGDLLPQPLRHAPRFASVGAPVDGFHCACKQ
jgi:hypothetical protein